MVVGGGPGGLTAATTAAAGGHRVAMTEQRLTGGTCVNFGCTPSKALIRCARAVHDAGRGAEYGFRLGAPPQADFGSVMDQVRTMRSLSSSRDAVEVAEQAGAEVYLGHTRFTTPNAVEVEGRRTAISEGRDRHRIGARGAPHRGTADRGVPDQRDCLLADRAASPAGRHRRRSDGMRAGPGLPPSRQRGGPGQPVPDPAAQ